MHHDLWDYDNAAAPKLLTVRHNGKPVEIVAQAGKTGFLYVFERQTGKPLWPIEERPVPKSEVPGEISSPTQPIPTKPPPFARQSLTPEEVNPFVSAEEQEKLKQLVRDAANDGVFTPSSHLRPHIQFPGAWGGANWGSTAGDPETGMLYVRSLEMISYRKMSLVEPSGAAVAADADKVRLRLAPASRKARASTCSAAPGAMAPGRCRCDRCKLSVRRVPIGRAARASTDAGVSAESTISLDALDALEAYLSSLPTSDEQAGNPRRFGCRRTRTAIRGRRRDTADRSRLAGTRATATRPARRGRSSSPTI